VNPMSSSSIRPGVAFTGIPTHAANLTAGFARGGTSVTVVTNYVGDMYNKWTQDNSFSFNNFYARFQMYVDRYTNRNLNVLRPAYAKSDVAVSQRITSSASFTVNIVNVGNNFGAESGSLNPALGRQTSMGVSLRYPRR
jgi:hypothetical protein